MSDGLWITGPWGQWVAEEHVVALADYLQKLRLNIERVALALPQPDFGPSISDPQFHATISWDEVRRIRLQLADAASEASRLQGALLRYAEQTGSQELARTRTFDASRDRLLALMVITFVGRPAPEGFAGWGFSEAAQALTPIGERIDGVSVSPSANSRRVIPAMSLAERVARIPSGNDAPIRIERSGSEGGPSLVEVYIGGTRDFRMVDSEEPFDMASNISLVAGATAASLIAVQLAMKSAGVSASDRVTFVGHSQGGLIATRLAESGAYNTVGLLTVGAPVGVAPVRGDYPALHLAHSDDLVPALGGHQVPSKAVRIEKHSGARGGDVIGAHSIGAYTQTAERADSSLAAHRFGSLPQGSGPATAQFFSAKRD